MPLPPPRKICKREDEQHEAAARRERTCSTPNPPRNQAKQHPRNPPSNKAKQQPRNPPFELAASTRNQPNCGHFGSTSTPRGPRDGKLSGSPRLPRRPGVPRHATERRSSSSSTANTLTSAAPAGSPSQRSSNPANRAARSGATPGRDKRGGLRGATPAPARVRASRCRRRAGDAARGAPATAPPPQPKESVGLVLLSRDGILFGTHALSLSLCLWGVRTGEEAKTGERSRTS
jgi:hypothetical protein